AFVPGAPTLCGSADYGHVGSFNLRGDWLWRDGLVARVGGLSISGDGTQLLLACFSEGLRRYDKDGKPLPTLALAEPSQLVAQSYDGATILAAGLSTQLWLTDARGGVRASQRWSQPIIALALGAR